MATILVALLVHGLSLAAAQADVDLTRTVISGKLSPLHVVTIPSTSFSVNYTSAFPDVPESSRSLIESLWSCGQSNVAVLTSRITVPGSSTFVSAEPAFTNYETDVVYPNQYDYSLCDGWPRLGYSGGTPITSSIATFSVIPAQPASFREVVTEPPPPCHPNNKTYADNCPNMWKIASIYQSEFLYYYSQGNAVMNLNPALDGPCVTPFVEPTSTKGDCFFQAAGATMLWWPDPASESIQPCQSTLNASVTTTAFLPNATATSVYVINGTAFTYPSVYIRYTGLEYGTWAGSTYATDWQKDSTVLAFRSDEISTLCGPSGQTTSLNWRDLYGPMRASAYYCQHYQCQDYVSTSGKCPIDETRSPNNPFIIWNTQFLPILSSLHPTNPDSCTFGNNAGGIFDPPHTLSRAGGFIPSPVPAPATTNPAPVTMELPTPAPTAANPPPQTSRPFDPAPTSNDPPPPPVASPSSEAQDPTVADPPAGVPPKQTADGPGTGGLGGVIDSIIKQSPTGADPLAARSTGSGGSPPTQNGGSSPAQHGGIPSTQNGDNSPTSGTNGSPPSATAGLGGVIASLLNQPPFVGPAGNAPTPAAGQTAAPEGAAAHPALSIGGSTLGFGSAITITPLNTGGAAQAPQVISFGPAGVVVGGGQTVPVPTGAAGVSTPLVLSLPGGVNLTAAPIPAASPPPPPPRGSPAAISIEGTTLPFGSAITLAAVAGAGAGETISYGSSGLVINGQTLSAPTGTAGMQVTLPGGGAITAAAAATPPPGDPAAVSIAGTTVEFGGTAAVAGQVVSYDSAGLLVGGSTLPVPTGGAGEIVTLPGGAVVSASSVGGYGRENGSVTGTRPEQQVGNSAGKTGVGAFLAMGIGAVLGLLML